MLGRLVGWGRTSEFGEGVEGVGGLGNVRRAWGEGEKRGENVERKGDGWELPWTAASHQGAAGGSTCRGGWYLRKCGRTWGRKEWWERERWVKLGWVGHCNAALGRRRKRELGKEGGALIYNAVGTVVGFGYG